MINLEIFQRHVIKRESQFNDFIDIVRKTVNAKNKTPHNFHIILNYTKDLSIELKDKILESTKILIENNIPLHISPALGAGNAFLQALEKSLSITKNGSSVSILVDGDHQYDISNQSTLDSIQSLAKELIEKNALLGLGRRDSIILGVDQEMQKLREIEELYYALFMKNSCELNGDLESINIPNSYKELGDPVPGCYFFNLFHTNFFDFINQVQKDFNKANLNRYAGDPYIVMCASKFGKVVSSRVNCEKNPPSAFRKEDFSEKYKEIKKTFLGQEYAYCLESEENSKVLQRFYDRSDVENYKKIAIQK